MTREELEQAAYNILNEYRKQAYGLVKAIAIDSDGYRFNHPVLPPSEQAFINDIGQLMDTYTQAKVLEARIDELKKGFDRWQSKEGVMLYAIRDEDYVDRLATLQAERSKL